MILYEGPSMLDGAHIVAIATIGTKNPKTAEMVQTWILRSDIAPHEAVKNGKDESICGDCPQRHYLKGACYVHPFQAPLSVWRRYKAGGYEDPKGVDKVKHALIEQPIRLGAYGDPCAVPFHVWESLIAQGCQKWTGYTHQWKQSEAQEYRSILMASCDSRGEANQAKAMSWRYFLVVADQAESTRGVVQCLSESKGMTCADCNICDGTRANSREVNASSVVIQIHGIRSSRFNLNVVR